MTKISREIKWRKPWRDRAKRILILKPISDCWLTFILSHSVSFEFLLFLCTATTHAKNKYSFQVFSFEMNQLVWWCQSFSRQRETLLKTGNRTPSTPVLSIIMTFDCVSQGSFIQSGCSKGCWTKNLVTVSWWIEKTHFISRDKDCLEYDADHLDDDSGNETCMCYPSVHE